MLQSKQMKNSLQNGITILKKETEDLEKESPIKTQISTRRQAHSSPTSNPPPRKKSKNHSKNKKGVSRRTRGPQQQVQVKDVINLNTHL